MIKTQAIKQWRYYETLTFEDKSCRISFIRICFLHRWSVSFSLRLSFFERNKTGNPSIFNFYTGLTLWHCHNWIYFFFHTLICIFFVNTCFIRLKLMFLSKAMNPVFTNRFIFNFTKLFSCSICRFPFRHCMNIIFLQNNKKGLLITLSRSK